MTAESALRILMLADVPPDPNLGMAGTEYQSALALRALGHHVEAVWSDELPHHIRHGNLHFLLELPRALERRMLISLKGSRYDIVHVNQPHGFRAARTLRRMNLPTAFIHRSHGLELRANEELAAWRTLYPATKRPLVRRGFSMVMERLVERHSTAIAQWADGHLVYTTEDASYLVTRMGVPRERVAAVGAAAPDCYLRTAAPPISGERAKTILYVSQFAFFKAPMITAEAMNRIAATVPEARFIWVAGREHHDAIRALLAPATLSRIEMYDWMKQEDLEATFERGGIFLFSSFYEGFGKVFLEAMSRGAAVVATDIAGAHDVIEHGVTGMLVPPGDSEALAAAAIALLNDPQRMARIGAAGAEAARKHSWQRVAQEMVTFYRARLRDRRP